MKTSPLAEDVQRMMETYQVCRRTAVRHLTRGTEPCAERRESVDGKRYPARHATAQPRTQLTAPLKIARSNVRRAARVAASEGLYRVELVLLREISAELSALLNGFAEY
jgi:hypothetical protein